MWFWYFIFWLENIIHLCWFSPYKCGLDFFSRKMLYTEIWIINLNTFVGFALDIKKKKKTIFSNLPFLSIDIRRAWSFARALEATVMAKREGWPCVDWYQAAVTMDWRRCSCAGEREILRRRCSYAGGREREREREREIEFMFCETVGGLNPESVGGCEIF